LTFITPVNITPLAHPFVYGDGLLFLGSCFANEVGGICKSLGFNAQVNPFGVLYNPMSIAQSLKRLQNGFPFTDEEVISVGEEFYCTFSHNTEFWNHSKQGLLECVNQSLKEACDHFAKCNYVILSLGTAWVYRFRATREVVANCHKLPSQLFERQRLTIETVSTCLSDLLQAFPDKEFIFTVSPLRHLKDGLHGNQLSKSTLLLAVNEICERFENAHYFPAYEILFDELRDYRFYKEDMVHPTDQAIHYIWEKFVDFAINPSERPAMKAAEDLKQMLQHKPLFPDSEAYRKFEALKRQKKAELARQFPAIQM